MVQIFGGDRELESRQDVLNFIMAGAEEEEQELTFPFEEEDIQNALANVRELARTAHEPTPKRRRSHLGGKKRGPEQSKVSVKMYHLPPTSSIPKNLKNLEDPDVKRHVENGYGYRNVDAKGPYADSLSVNDDNDAIRDYIHLKHPMLNNQDFHLYTLSKGRKLKELHVNTTRELKELRYQGTIFVYSAGNGHHPDATAAAEHKDDAANDRINSVIDMSELRKRLYSKLNDTQEIVVERDEICSNAIEFYKNNPDIVNCKLYVSFANENGDDFMGLTREFFSEFWRQFLQGTSEQINLDANPLVIDESYHKAIGRILVHGYILTGFLPTRLNWSSLYKLLSGKEPSADLCIESYLMSIVPVERTFISEKLKAETFEMQDKIRLATIFESYRLAGLPSGKEELYQSICRIGKFVSWVGPSYTICNMRSGCSLPELQVLEEVTFKEYLDKLKCTGNNIVNCLDAPTFSDDPVTAELETKVYENLQRYVQGLGPEKCADFLRFVTGHEVVTGIITLEFNGNTNRELMLPKGHTCGMVIELSKFIRSYSDLELLITNALDDKKASTGYHFS